MLLLDVSMPIVLILGGILALSGADRREEVQTRRT